MNTSSVFRIGFWSALCSTIFAIIYIVPQLIIGIDMPSSPADLLLILGPSLLLAPAFVVMMTSVHYFAPQEKRIWSHIGLSFSIAYFVFVSIVYFVGLTVQLPHTIQGDLDQFQILKYVPKSFMTAIDALGYSSMSLGMLFTAQVFGGTRLQWWIRRVFIANGVLVPVILLTQIYPEVAYIGAFWIVTFPLSTSLVAVLFRRQITAGEE